MPHTRKPPDTPSEILATAESDPSWTRILEESPVILGADWGEDCTLIKQLSEGMLPRLRSSLDACRPADITERDIYIDIPSTSLKTDGGRIRVLISHRKQEPASSVGSAASRRSPVIVLFHGGGHTIGNPEGELPLARHLVQHFNAIVVMPAYRLAPDHVFPSSFSDSFEVIKILAEDIQTVRSSPSFPERLSTTRILPDNVNLTTDFILGGTSAGATISASINHLYHSWHNPTESDSRLPSISGLFLSCGTYINSLAVPTAYKPFYLSHAQNRDAPPIDQDMYKIFANAAKADFADPVESSFDQVGRGTKLRDKVGEDHAWMAGNSDMQGTGECRRQAIRVYFQACGQDMSRDDSLIYERVLREECGVETRIDLYEGFGHVFWGMGGKYPELDMSLKRTEDSIEGVQWLLRG